MTTARREMVDVNLTRWYHCISRCVRSAFLMAEGRPDRKQWIEDRLQVLSQNFSIAVGSFAVMDNHLHVLVRLDPEISLEWSAEEVVRRWSTVYRPRHLSDDDPRGIDRWVSVQARDLQRVEQLRSRLSNLGWFMKALKEPLSRLANKEDGCRGAFWEARYKSIAILDIEALLATSAYIDLNPLAAGLSSTPETSRHTSLKQRVDHACRRGKLGVLKSARLGSVIGSRSAGDLEQNHWLLPLEDRRGSSSSKSSGGVSVRGGMLESFSLGSYLQLVEYTGRCYRRGKTRISSRLQEIFERLGTSEAYWSSRMQKMLSGVDLRGHFYAADPQRVRELSARRGKRLANLTPQSAVP